MEIFEPLGARFGIERVSFDIVEQIAGIGARHQIEPFPRNTLPQFKGRRPRLSGVLQPRLDPQLLQRSIGESAHPALAPSKRSHGIDARRFELADLALHNTCGQVEAVCLLPCIPAMVPPSTKIAERTRDGTGLRRIPDEILQALACETRIFGILRQPKANPLARAELDVRLLRRMSLDRSEQIRIQRQLKHVARSGLTLQFGIRDLIGKRPQVRRNGHAFQEVRVPSPHSAIERRLKDNVRPVGQGIPGGF